MLYRVAGTLVLASTSASALYYLRNQMAETPRPAASVTDVDLRAKYLAFSKKTVQSFQESKFQVVGWHSSNCHYQTIVGSGALHSKLYGDPARPFTTTLRRIDTEDNDFFFIEYCNSIDDSDDVVIVLHGLEGTSRSAHITNTAVACMQKGFSCILFSFRGCNGIPNNNPGAYHVGFTQDLAQTIELLHKEHPQKRFYLTGTSLGGNVILKYLGEQGWRAKEELKVGGAAVACVPFDPKTCQSKLDVGLSRAIYSENFLRSLKQKGEVQIARFPGSFDIEGVRRAKTVGDFDDAYIAKIYGYRDKFDYYEQNGSIRFLHKIRVPAIAISALDDPFIDERGLPQEAEHVQDAPVRLIYHQNGGHCGFATSRMSGALDAPPVPPHGWLAEEFSRALAHIRDQLKEQEKVE